MKKQLIVLTAIAGLLSFSPAVQAQPGPRGKGYGQGAGPGAGKGWRRGGRGGCRGMMFAHPDVLKERFKLTDNQARRVQNIRDNMLSKRITHSAQAKQYGLKLHSAMQADRPNEARVLALHRKMRAERGKAAEEGIKARIKIINLLTPEQRKQIRSSCAAGKGWGQGWGKGRGWAHRGGGRGFRGGR
jgi:Spy/CpxP family protein refolding chaperone